MIDDADASLRLSPTAWIFPAEEQAKTYGRAATSERSQIEYARDWADFVAYCSGRRLSALPAAPQTVAIYISHLAGHLKVCTIRRRLVAIAREHATVEAESPTRHKAVRDVMIDIVKTLGTAKTQKTALTDGMLRSILPRPTRDLRTTRDRAILLLGFSAALRRSELAALLRTDCDFDERGLTLTLRNSKTNQTGVGRTIAVPYVGGALCAVTAVQAWLSTAQIYNGPLFRSFGLPAGPGAMPTLNHNPISGRDVARIVQRYARSLAGDFSAHSLRAGFVLSAAQKKVPEVDIMRVTGHGSVAILRDYVRKATLFDGTPLLAILARENELT